MEGVLIILAIALIAVIIALVGGSTSTRQAMLNTVGLDLSESAKEDSLERDKIRKAKLHINSAEDFVKYHFPNRCKNELDRLQFVKRTINDEFEELSYPNGMTEQGWYFTGDREIQGICNNILDDKIKKLQK